MIPRHEVIQFTRTGSWYVGIVISDHAILVHSTHKREFDAHVECERVNRGDKSSNAIAMLDASTMGRFEGQSYV